MTRRTLRLSTVPFALAVTGLLAGCVANDPPAATEESSTTVTVDSSATECILSADTAPSGTLVFEVSNSGQEVTEFYLLSEDGDRVVSELENIGPGISRDLVVTVEPGSYLTACKPGMTGEGIRAEFTVTDA